MVNPLETTRIPQVADLRTVAAVRRTSGLLFESLGVRPDDKYQPLDAELANIASLGIRAVLGGLEGSGDVKMRVWNNWMRVPLIVARRIASSVVLTPNGLSYAEQHPLPRDLLVTLSKESLVIDLDPGHGLRLAVLARLTNARCIGFARSTEELEALGSLAKANAISNLAWIRCTVGLLESTPSRGTEAIASEESRDVVKSLDLAMLSIDHAEHDEILVLTDGDNVLNTLRGGVEFLRSAPVQLVVFDGPESASLDQELERINGRADPGFGLRVRVIRPVRNVAFEDEGAEG